MVRKAQTSAPEHVAIIMDGNGRWAQARGKPRLFGHHAGAKRVREIVEACPELGVKYLTIFAFSTENWTRPEAEISELFKLLRLFIRRDLADLHKNNVIIRVIGEENPLVRISSLSVYCGVFILSVNPFGSSLLFLFFRS